MLRANFHTHTTFCDGADTPQVMAERALELGFFALGFSGHMDPEVFMDWEAYREEVLRLQGELSGRLDVLLGVELDNLTSPSACPGAEYLIGSTHYVPAGGDLVCVDDTPERLLRGCDEHFGGDWYALSRAYFDFESQVADRTGCTFVGHFDLVTRFNDELHFLDEQDPRYLGPALECMEHLVSLGIPFEVNTGALAKGRKAEPYPSHALLRALHSFGGEVLISSDAHSAGLLDGGFAQAEALIAECGFTHVNVLGHDLRGGVEMRQVPLDAR